MRWLALVVVSVVFILAMALPVPTVSAATYFPQTGHSIADAFFGYWTAHGGLPQLGYPITDQMAENGRTVQYFERAVFEYWPENPEPYKVQLRLLGNLTAAGRQGEGPFWRHPTGESTSYRWYFSQTGHNLQWGFLNYWLSHGGVDIFGYPISEEFTEQSPTDGKYYTVQYFERNRFEYHPENKGTVYETLLGLLGTEYYKTKYGVAPTFPQSQALIGTPRQLGDYRVTVTDLKVDTSLPWAPSDPNYRFLTVNLTVENVGSKELPVGNFHFFSVRTKDGLRLQLYGNKQDGPGYAEDPLSGVVKPGDKLFLEYTYKVHVGYLVPESTVRVSFYPPPGDSSQALLFELPVPRDKLPASAPFPADNTPDLGTTATEWVGNYAITVNSSDTAVTSGGEHRNYINVTIQNIGTGWLTIDSMRQFKLQNAEGGEPWTQVGGSALNGSIAPGGRLTGELTYVIPQGASFYLKLYFDPLYANDPVRFNLILMGRS